MLSADGSLTLMFLSLTAPCRINMASGFYPAGQEILLFLYHACAQRCKNIEVPKEKYCKLTGVLILPENSTSWEPETNPASQARS